MKDDSIVKSEKELYRELSKKLDKQDINKIIDNADKLTNHTLRNMTKEI